jgi:hypothetical protein
VVLLADLDALGSEDGAADQALAEGQGAHPSPFNLPPLPFKPEPNFTHIMPVAVARTLKRGLVFLHVLRQRVVGNAHLSSLLRRKMQDGGLDGGLPALPAGLPVWWQAGKHDKSLLRGVGKHGLGRWRLVQLDRVLGWPLPPKAKPFKKETGGNMNAKGEREEDKGSTRSKTKEVREHTHTYTPG